MTLRSRFSRIRRLRDFPELVEGTSLGENATENLLLRSFYSSVPVYRP